MVITPDLATPDRVIPPCVVCRVVPRMPVQRALQIVIGDSEIVQDHPGVQFSNSFRRRQSRAAKAEPPVSPVDLVGYGL